MPTCFAGLRPMAVLGKCEFSVSENKKLRPTFDTRAINLRFHGPWITRLPSAAASSAVESPP
eukprot:1968891-Heterocapsa_arctica.AAC.1